MTTSLRRALPWTLLAVGVLVVGVLVATGARTGPPLDPRSPAPDGTRALVEVLAELGTDVDTRRSVDELDVPVALLLVDHLDEDARAALEDWIDDGGTAVVADPLSPLTPDPVDAAAIGPLGTRIARDCDVAALAAVEHVRDRGGTAMESPEGAQGCFPHGEGHWLVARSAGEGLVVALGGPNVFTNAGLSEEDNALLAAALLTPAAGVALLQPPLPGEGEATLPDLVPSQVWFALGQLLVAFLLVVAWRARRLGRPVEEPQPVAIPGSELVVAVGNLLQQTGSRGEAGRALREDLRRDLTERFGLPPDASAEAVVDAAGTRAGTDPDVVRRGLLGPAPADDDELVRLARRIEEAREEVRSPVRGGDAAVPAGDGGGAR